MPGSAAGGLARPLAAPRRRDSDDGIDQDARVVPADMNDIGSPLSRILRARRDATISVTAE